MISLLPRTPEVRPQGSPTSVTETFNLGGVALYGDIEIKYFNNGSHCFIAMVNNVGDSDNCFLI